MAVTDVASLKHLKKREFLWLRSSFHKSSCNYFIILFNFLPYNVRETQFVSKSSINLWFKDLTLQILVFDQLKSCRWGKFFYLEKNKHEILSNTLKNNITSTQFTMVYNTEIYAQETPSRWNSPCGGEEAYPLRSSNQSTSTRRAQLSVAAKVVRPTDLLNNVKTWVNTD